MGKYGAAVTSGADKITRATALAVDAAVVVSTPVDTGRARSNWLVNIDSARNEVIAPYSEGKGLGLGEAANLSAALEQGAGEIAKFNGEKNFEIHITNNVAYIGELNNGSSAQAPANFVEAGIQAGAAKVRKSKLFQQVQS